MCKDKRNEMGNSRQAAKQKGQERGAWKRQDLMKVKLKWRKPKRKEKKNEKKQNEIDKLLSVRNGKTVSKD